VRYCFENFSFDTDRRELRRGADLVSIAPQAFDLLEYLIRNKDRVVSKDDLINVIWGGRAVSDAALTTRLNAARSAIGDSGEEQRLIKTLSRRGFRFVGVVQEILSTANTAIVEPRPQLPNPTFSPEGTTRRLAAILFADTVSYSAALERDDEGTVAAMVAIRREVIEPRLAEHQGRSIAALADSFLGEFASPLAALKCALAIQADLVDRNLKLRIGINLGDVLVENTGGVHGESIMVAWRLQALAKPGGILVSDKIFREVEGKVDIVFEDCGEQTIKNTARPFRAYRVQSA
jgi:class 3 adenylate cyclase